MFSANTITEDSMVKCMILWTGSILAFAILVFLIPDAFAANPDLRNPGVIIKFCATSPVIEAGYEGHHQYDVPLPNCSLVRAFSPFFETICNNFTLSKSSEVIFSVTSIVESSGLILFQFIFGNVKIS